MAARINTRDDLYTYLADARPLYMVREAGQGYDLILDFLEDVAQRFDLVPPLPLIHDITSLVFLGERTRFRSIEEYPATFGPNYRNVLDTLLRHDTSVAVVSHLAAGMTPAGQRLFRGFFLATVSEVISRHIAPGLGSEITYFSRDFLPPADELTVLLNGTSPAYTTGLQQEIRSWLEAATINRKPLFTQEELFVFRYYVQLRERHPDLQENELHAFLQTLREYGRLTALFSPFSRELIRLARRIRQTLTPVNEESLLACGGYKGIRSSGNLDRAESMLPSELAFMEDNNQEPDLFDIHLIENRLLFFTRDTNFSLRKKRFFHIIFWEPEEMDYKAVHLPVRWSFVFLALAFQLVGFFRDYFSLRYYPFRFVFDRDSLNSAAARMVELIGGRDYPDVSISCRTVNKEDLEAYFDREIRGGAEFHSVILIGRNSSLNRAKLPERYSSLHQIRMGFAGADDGEAVRLSILGDTVNWKQEVRTQQEAINTLHQLRDSLTLEVIAGGRR